MSEKYIYYILDEIQKGSFGEIFEDITKKGKELVIYVYFIILYIL